MSDCPTEQPKEAGPWNADAFGESLARAESAGQIFVLEGLSPSHLHRDTPTLRNALSQHGLPVFVLDPTGGAGTGEKFFDILVAYVQEVESRGQLPEKAKHLFEFITTTREQKQGGMLGSPGGHLHIDCLCRLWASLTEALPSVCVVANAQFCQQSELDVLAHLVDYFFADPIEQLAPEVQAAQEEAGRLVFVRGGDNFPIDLSRVATTTVDMSKAAEDEVRQFLADPKVVRRFVESTGGDPRRLGELVESLPANIEHFWLFRYEQLEVLERTLVEVLAVAEEPLAVDTVHSALSLMQSSEYFARSMRRLVELGFVERKIKASAVQLHIKAPEFAQAIRESLDEDYRRQAHCALADAVLASDNQEPSYVFLARHYLASDNHEAGLEYGRRATKQLAAQRCFDEARDLLERLVECASAPDELREIHTQLADVHRTLGNYRKALAHCRTLEQWADDPQVATQLRCQSGQLLTDIGEYDSALRLYDEAEEMCRGEELREDWLRAKLGQSQVMYLQGRHEAAVERVDEVLTFLEEEASEEGGMQRAYDASRIEARNMVAKVEILCGKRVRARSLLESNRDLATDWGWDDEVARAEANLGLVALEEKKFDEARQCIERALEIARSPDAVHRAYAWINLGIIEQRSHRYDEALRFYLESLRASRQSGDEAGYGVAAHNLVTLYQNVGAFERALTIIEHMRERQADSAAGYFFVGESPTLVHGGIMLDKQRYEEAIQTFAKCTEVEQQNLAQSLSYKEAQLRSVLAHLALGQRKAAQRVLDEFEMPDESDIQPQLTALWDLGCAAIALDAGDPEMALRVGPEAMEKSKSAGHLRDALRVAQVLARALRLDERPEEARALLETQLEQLCELAAHVPEPHLDDFFAVPLHLELVDELEELGGEAPQQFLDARESDCEASQEDVQPADTESAGFRKWRSRYSKIVGEDARLHQIFRVIDRVAESDSPVLLYGESGTGKELLAEAVHRHSERGDEKLVRVNCGAFVDDLLLSELFGHVKGAFTGAVSEKEGCFERADGGTIFLDEIGDIAPKTQVALLRVLQEGTFEKVGGSETKSVDVRVVCATNKNLEQMVKRGEFRLDLYYRLKGVVVEVPPLRERRQDIPRLVSYFAKRYCQGREPRRFGKEVLQFLTSYSWPGNIRELQHFVKNILLFVEGETVEMSHVQELGEFFSDGEIDTELREIDYDVSFEEYEDVGETYDDPEDALVDQIIANGLSLSNIKKRLEMESIRRALVKTGGNITRAAEVLQMKRPRLSQIVNSTDELLALKEELVG